MHPLIGVVSIDEEHIEGPHLGRALALRVAHDELHVGAHALGTEDLAQAGVVLGRDVDRVDGYGRVRAGHQEHAATVEAPDLEDAAFGHARDEEEVLSLPESRRMNSFGSAPRQERW